MGSGRTHSRLKKDPYAQMPDEVTEDQDQLFRLDDERWMRRALELATQAELAGEVPVGAVLVANGKVLGEGFNQPIQMHDPTAHAEMLAIRAAAQQVQNYRLAGSTLYVTLEPCPMCAGAIVQARIRRVVFGGRDLRFGGVRSKFRLADSDLLNHQAEIVEGVLATECLELLRRFFATKR